MNAKYPSTAQDWGALDAYEGEMRDPKQFR
jgi:hypothetical protein